MPHRVFSTVCLALLGKRPLGRRRSVWRRLRSWGHAYSFAEVILGRATAAEMRDRLTGLLAERPATE